jgi:hypothetical protein
MSDTDVNLTKSKQSHLFLNDKNEINIIILI